jgi:hypothetical protein
MSEDGLTPEDFHRKSMGIVMKRRDNAPIVKYVYGVVRELSVLAILLHFTVLNLKKVLPLGHCSLLAQSNVNGDF